MSTFNPKQVKRLESSGYQPPLIDRPENFDEPEFIAVPEYVKHQTGRMPDPFAEFNQWRDNSFAANGLTVTPKPAKKKFSWKKLSITAAISRAFANKRERERQKQQSLELEAIMEEMRLENETSKRETKEMLERMEQESARRRKTDYSKERDRARLDEIDRRAALLRARKPGVARLDTELDPTGPTRQDSINALPAEHYDALAFNLLERHRTGHGDLYGLNKEGHYVADPLGEKSLRLPNIPEDKQAEFMCNWILSDRITKEEALMAIATENPRQYIDYIDFAVLRAKLGEQNKGLRKSTVAFWNKLRRRFGRKN